MGTRPSIKLVMENNNHGGNNCGGKPQADSLKGRILMLYSHTTGTLLCTKTRSDVLGFMDVSKSLLGLVNRPEGKQTPKI